MIVGLVGLKGSGKDTVAEILTQHSGHDFRQIAFADRLKEDVLKVNPRVAEAGGIPLGYIVGRLGWQAAKAIPSVRKFLEDYGQAFRSIDSNHWISAIGVAMGAEPHRHWVVSDVRFRNEADALQGFAEEMGTGLRLVLVRRKSAIDATHTPSEAEKYAHDLSKSCYPFSGNVRVDHVLNNEQSIAALAGHVGSMVMGWGSDGLV